MKIKKGLNFIKKQIFKEFFGFLGFLFGSSIFVWGVIFQDAKVQTSSLTVTGFSEVVFSIPVYIVGILLTTVFLLYLYFKRK